MKRSRLNLATVPKRAGEAALDAHAQTALSSRSETDSAIAGYGSAIDIPRTKLSKGGHFGEVITPEAITFAVRREPVAKRLVMDVADDIFDKWFEVEPIKKTKESEGSEENNTLDQNVQTVLEKLDAKNICIQAAQYERRYGWSIIVLGFKDSADLTSPVEGATEIDHLAVYSPRSTIVETEDEKPDSPRFGLPVTYKINRGKSQFLKVHYSRVIHIATRLDEHPYKGVSVLENVWDDMTILRNIRWAAGQVYWRMAGLLVFTLPKDYKKAEIENFFNSMGDPNVRTFLGIPDDKKVELLSAAGRVLSPSEFIDPMMRSVSIGSSIPKQKLEGTEAGAVTGSEVNQREYYKYISDQQKLYESEIVGPLIDLLMEIGQVQPDTDYTIEWESAFELDSVMKASAELSDSQTAANELKYMTIDEVRAKRSLKPLSEVTSGKEDGQILATPQPNIPFNNSLPPENPNGQGDAARSHGPANLEKSLAGGLASIIRKCYKGAMSKEDAKTKGQTLIDSHFERVIAASKQRLGRNTSDLPPEAIKRLERDRAQAITDFTGVIDDAK